MWNGYLCECAHSLQTPLNKAMKGGNILTLRVYQLLEDYV